MGDILTQSFEAHELVASENPSGFFRLTVAHPGARECLDLGEAGWPLLCRSSVNVVGLVGSGKDSDPWCASTRLFDQPSRMSDSQSACVGGQAQWLGSALFRRGQMGREWAQLERWHSLASWESQHRPRCPAQVLLETMWVSVWRGHESPFPLMV